MSSHQVLRRVFSVSAFRRTLLFAAAFLCLTISQTKAQDQVVRIARQRPKCHQSLMKGFSSTSTGLSSG
jgi:hypothetical protein